jgi:hypothetical protein
MVNVTVISELRDTPLPWSVRHAKGKSSRTIFDADGHVVATIKMVRTNRRGATKKLADFIVSAVHARNAEEVGLSE